MQQSAYLNQHETGSLSLIPGRAGGTCHGLDHMRRGSVELMDERACVCDEQQSRRCWQARAASHKFTVISPRSWQSHTVTVPCQSVAVWAVGRAVCAQCSGCLLAAASLYQLQMLTRPTCPHYNTQVNTICLQSGANSAVSAAPRNS